MTDHTANQRGALLMATSMVTFTINDTFIKAVSDELPLFQVITLRGLAVTLALLIAARALGRRLGGIAVRDRWLIALRTAGEVGGTWFFLTALFHMPIANVSAILQALPLSVTLGTAVFFGERVGWRRWTAIAVGFAGVMLIVRPGADGFTVYSLYALAAVASVTVRDLAARRLSAEVPSMAVALAAAVGVTVFGVLGSAVTPWQPVSALAAAQLSGAVVALLFGYVTSVMAMRVGEIGVVAPFRYSSLVAALILGFVIFGDWPAPLTLLGSAVVVATGLFTLWRERRNRLRVIAPVRLR